jgi:hypothetical protein
LNALKNPFRNPKRVFHHGRERAQKYIIYLC